MSKSLGNVVNPLDLIDRYGVDAVRYFLVREMVPGLDASFTPELFIKRYNSDLANDFGNLLNRVSGLLGKYFAGRVPDPGQPGADEEAVRSAAEDLPQRVNAHIEAMRVHEAIEEIMQLVRSVNKYMEYQAPWKLAKTDLPAAGRVLYTASEALRLSAVLLEPVMPEKTKTVLEILGAVATPPAWGGLKPGTVLQTHDPLFPRIEVTVGKA